MLIVINVVVDPHDFFAAELGRNTMFRRLYNIGLNKRARQHFLGQTKGITIERQAFFIKYKQVTLLALPTKRCENYK